MNNFPDVNPKFFRLLGFPLKLFFLKITLFLFFLLENLTITRSFCIILRHASRSLGEAKVPVRDKAWYIDFSSCVSWISSGTEFISTISLLRYCEDSETFLCNVSICLERSFEQCFDISSSDSNSACFPTNSANLDVRFASSS